MKKKRMYESPHTQVNTVVTESGFCAASVIDTKDKGIKTEGHQTGTSFDANAWGSGNDENGWK